MDGTVLVAGGTGALGSGVVRALLEAGRRVTVSWVVKEEADRLTSDLGGADGLDLVEIDVLDPASVEAAAEGIPDLAGVVDLVGGYAGGSKAHEIEPEELDRMLALNLRQLHVVARATVPRLLRRGGGPFVGVSARAALRPGPGQAAYNAAKAAVLAYIQSLDADYREEGLRANAILPSVIDTPANRAAMPDADHAGWVQPRAIGDVVAFLVSEESAATTGAAVPVYGRT